MWLTIWVKNIIKKAYHYFGVKYNKGPKKKSLAKRLKNNHKKNNHWTNTLEILDTINASNIIHANKNTKKSLLSALDDLSQINHCRCSDHDLIKLSQKIIELINYARQSKQDKLFANKIVIKCLSIFNIEIFYAIFDNLDKSTQTIFTQVAIQLMLNHSFKEWRNLSCNETLLIRNSSNPEELISLENENILTIFPILAPNLFKKLFFQVFKENYNEVYTKIHDNSLQYCLSFFQDFQDKFIPPYNEVIIEYSLHKKTPKLHYLLLSLDGNHMRYQDLDILLESNPTIINSLQIINRSNLFYEILMPYYNLAQPTLRTLKKNIKQKQKTAVKSAIRIPLQVKSPPKILIPEDDIIEGNVVCSIESASSTPENTNGVSISLQNICISFDYYIPKPHPYQIRNSIGNLNLLFPEVFLSSEQVIQASKFINKLEKTVLYIQSSEQELNHPDYLTPMYHLLIQVRLYLLLQHMIYAIEPSYSDKLVSKVLSHTDVDLNYFINHSPKLKIPNELETISHLNSYYHQYPQIFSKYSHLQADLKLIEQTYHTYHLPYHRFGLSTQLEDIFALLNHNTYEHLQQLITLIQLWEITELMLDQFLLFGSTAYRPEDSSDDIDLCLVIKDSLSLLNLEAFQYSLVSVFNTNVELIPIYDQTLIGKQLKLKSPSGIEISILFRDQKYIPNIVNEIPFDLTTNYRLTPPQEMITMMKAYDELFANYPCSLWVFSKNHLDELSLYLTTIDEHDNYQKDRLLWHLFRQTIGAITHNCILPQENDIFNILETTYEQLKIARESSYYSPLLQCFNNQFLKKHKRISQWAANTSLISARLQTSNLINNILELLHQELITNPAPKQALETFNPYSFFHHAQDIKCLIFTPPQYDEEPTLIIPGNGYI